jgi:polyhydroxybutyrate depolymerase
MPQTFAILVSVLLAAEPFGPGDHFRSLDVDGQSRSYVVHVPPKYDPQQPTPVVLAFHGAGTNAPIMALSSGLNAKSDAAGFVVVYPNGTGKGNLLLVWNSGGLRGPLAEKLPDDVAFVKRLLDDLATVINVDSKRVYATGMSNGGMMCYRLAAELSDRIAAIAPVGGTMAMSLPRPRRPVSVMHFHGTADNLVPFDGPDERMAKFLAVKSVRETIRTWANIDRCPETPKVIDLPDAAEDGTTVTQESYGPGEEGTEVILFVIQDGGHTWPGKSWPVPWLGKTTSDISANDLLWEFFERHPMK